MALSSIRAQQQLQQTRGALNKSPFFAPQPPRSHLLTTPNGSINRVKDVDDPPKSSVAGATFNLINAIVGAGIVGIPFAVDQCSLVIGVSMVLAFAALTVKSLRLLIETAKHVDVSSYERLAEVSFGKTGFNLIAIAMFIMSYGALVGYMIIVKSNLSMLLGVDASNVYMTRAVLTVSSLSVMLPLALQRDVSNLSKTSAISVAFDTILVAIVAYYSPIQSNIEVHGGMKAVIINSTPDITTFFTGIGVLCFAFVCQHSAFIIAASLEKPTRERWNMVTTGALTVCAILAAIMGVAGFLGFIGETDGDILVNLGVAALDGDFAMQRAANVARGLLCTTMFFVWPVELFVARHVCVVMFFKGRRAHEGDDHSVLARRDRRVAVTVFIYLISLLPSLLFDDLGSVFSVTGSLGGATLSYIGPGLFYLGVHGGDFLKLVSNRWGSSYIPKGAVEEEREMTKNHIAGVSNATLAMFGGNEDMGMDKNRQKMASEEEKADDEKNIFMRFIDWILWYILLMPIWCRAAVVGKEMLEKHREAEALKSPMPYALGKIIHHHKDKPQSQYRNLIKPQQGPMSMMHHAQRSSGGSDDDDDNSDHDNERKPLIRTLSLQNMKPKGGTAVALHSPPPLPPSGRPRSSRARVGFSLGPSHGPMNEKHALDRSRSISQKSFSSASFEVVRSNSYGSTATGVSVQDEVKMMKRQQSPMSNSTSNSNSHRRQNSDLSALSIDDHLSHATSTGHGDEDDSNMSSVFLPDQHLHTDSDNDISHIDDDEEHAHEHHEEHIHNDSNDELSSVDASPVLKPKPAPTSKPAFIPHRCSTIDDDDDDDCDESNDGRDSSIPKVVKAPRLDKIKVAPAVVKRMYERGNVVSIAVRTGRDDDGEDDPQDEDPSVMDFAIAIFYIMFGLVAASAGLFSSFM